MYRAMYFLIFPFLIHETIAVAIPNSTFSDDRPRCWSAPNSSKILNCDAAVAEMPSGAQTVSFQWTPIQLGVVKNETNSLPQVWKGDRGMYELNESAIVFLSRSNGSDICLP